MKRYALLVLGLAFACAEAPRAPVQSGAGASSGDAGAAGEAGEGNGGSSGGGAVVSLMTSSVDSPVMDEDDEEPALMVLAGFDEAGLVPDSELRVHIDRKPRHGQITLDGEPGASAAAYRPQRDYFGTDRFTFVVKDLEGHSSAPREVSIEVRPVNDAPVAKPDRDETDSLTELELDLTGNDVDVDGDELTVVSITQPSPHAATIRRDGRVSFTPEHPNSGRVAFEYTVADPDGLEATAVVEIDVTEAGRVRISSFTAEPDAVASGEEVTLAWTTENAFRCELSGPSGELDIDGETSGTLVIEPVEPALYSLGCEGPGGPVSESIPVVVLGTGGPDRDADGISDAIEAVTGTRPDDSDSDDDGVPDGLEDTNADGGVDVGETDPREPDSDADGLCDGLRTYADDEPDPPSDCLGPVLVDAASSATDPDGARWESAFSVLQDAVDLAEQTPGREVWVRVGTYRSSAPQDPVLRLAPASSVYGGFIGTETHRAARDPSSRGTVLDGDHLGDDTDVPAVDSDQPEGNPASNRADNSDHVVVGAKSALLDGFRVRHGHAAAIGAYHGGGGLLALHPGLTVANTDFIANSSTGSGGAVLCEDECDLSLDDVLFHENRAGNGGAIRASTRGALTLATATFTDNLALDAGGAVEVRGASTELTASDVVCLRNFASGFGGCFHLREAPGVLTRVSALENRAGGGAALFASGSSVTVRDATFTANSGVRGGALNLLGGANLTLEDFELSQNAADDQGGALHVEASSATLRNGVLAANTVPNLGGAVVGLEEASIALVDVELVDNDAFVGGGVSLTESTLACKNVTFEANTAAYAGAVYATYTAVSIESSALVGNSAELEGGGLYLGASSLELDDTVVAGNSAGQRSGGIVAGDGATLALTDVTIARNVAGLSGGGLDVLPGTSAVLERVVFLANETIDGAGLVVNGDVSLDATDLAFVDNRANAAGALWASMAPLPFTITLRDTAFVGNQATEGGAAVIAYAPQELLGAGTLEIVGATFADNATVGGGGALVAQGAAPLLANVTFLGNRGELGGAIRTTRSSEPRIFHTSFFDNGATAAGGGIYNDSTSRLTLGNVVFWGSSGTGPDIHDLGSTSSIEYSAGAQAFPGSSNGVLLANPFAPVQAGRVYLDQSRTTPPTALDAGDNALAADDVVGFAALGLPAYSALTTAVDRTLDTGNVDLGRHYSPTAVRIEAFAAQTGTVTWQTSHADRCVLFDAGSVEVVVIDPEALGAGSREHAHAAGARLTLVCFGPEGEPAVAFASAP